MAYNSKYVSRIGRLSCNAAELFGFITDIRNLGQFIPEGSISNWHATVDSCSFGFPPMGIVNFRITEKIPFSLVSYSGDALQKNDFNLNVEIFNNNDRPVEVRLILTADLNPVLKMMASGTIDKFLEILISEMEKFGKWNQTFKES